MTERRRHIFSWSRNLIFPVSLLAAVGSLSSFAAPLDKDACSALQTEMQGLKALEVAKLMEKGPQWAVSHLSAADLMLVRRYIDVDEQVKFRCTPIAALAHLPGLEEDEDDGGQADPAKPAPQAAAKPQKKAAAAAAPAAAKLPVANKPAVKTPKAQPHKKDAGQPVQATLGNAPPQR